MSLVIAVPSPDLQSRSTSAPVIRPIIFLFYNHCSANMPIKDLLAGECGGPNPLVAASQHLTRNTDVDHRVSGCVIDCQQFIFANQELIGPRGVPSEFFTHEGASSSSLRRENVFKMDALLNDMHRIDKEAFLQSQDTRAEGAISGIHKKWTHMKPIQDYSQSRWASEYLNSQQEARSTAGHAVAPLTFYRPNLLTSQYYHPGSVMANQMMTTNQLMQPMSAVFAHQQLEQMYRDRELTLAEEARRLVSTVKHDNELYSTEFLDFVDKIAQDKITLDPGAQAAEQKESAPPKEEEKDDLEFWNYLANEWDQMAREDNDAYSWLNHEPAGDIYNDYFFTEENPYKETPDPLEEGLKKLREGDIPSAVLLFEAACQQQPENAYAWQLLGTTQAKNEHDPAAIRAIKKSLELEPNNLSSLMALAVSYTNEALQKQACDALGQWIKSNPAYADVASRITSDAADPVNPMMVSSVATSVQFSQVKDAYIAAARKIPINLDPDVQAGLGVLFNLSGEYEKATDCFQAALQSRPDDALLWNRLGATLANGNRSEEAVAAYRRALEISPGFIRARFNLGISCVNLGAHKEAVQHFLAVLNFQNAGRGPQGQSSRTIMSNNVWSSLRMALSLMNRQDLYDLVERRDLTSLNREFSSS